MLLEILGKHDHFAPWIFPTCNGGLRAPVFFMVPLGRGVYLRGMQLTDNLHFLAETSPEKNWEQTIPNWPFYLTEEQAPDPLSLLAIAELAELSVDALLKKSLRSVEARKKTLPKLILLDVDGTLSDGGMYYTEHGDQMKKFNVKDGFIIYRLVRRQHVQFGLISSGSAGNIMKKRAETLGIQHLYYGTRPKVDVIEEWLAELGIGWEDLAYVGDDLNDLEVIKRVGLSACPADASRRVREHADVVLRRDGGQGCIREFLEEVLPYEI